MRAFLTSEVVTLPVFNLRLNALTFGVLLIAAIAEVALEIVLIVKVIG